MDDLEAKVIGILAAQALIDPATVRPEDDPAGIGLDSLGMVEAIFAMEVAFGISVPFNANEPGASEFDISTVASVIDGVRRLVAAKA